MEEHIEGLRETLYNHSVFLANHQFIFHGISIVCKLLGLGVLAGAVFFAISAKGRLSDYSVGLLGASISFILDLSETLTNIIGQSVELYNTLTDTIVITLPKPRKKTSRPLTNPTMTPTSALSLLQGGPKMAVFSTSTLTSLTRCSTSR